MRVIAFIMEPRVIKRILDHIRKRDRVSRPPHTPSPPWPKPPDSRLPSCVHHGASGELPAGGLSDGCPPIPRGSPLLSGAATTSGHRRWGLPEPP
jgi:hypothetical protein